MLIVSGSVSHQNNSSSVSTDFPGLNVQTGVYHALMLKLALVVDG